jgi:hypothetical protein
MHTVCHRYSQLLKTITFTIGNVFDVLKAITVPIWIKGDNIKSNEGFQVPRAKTIDSVKFYLLCLSVMQ